MVWISFFIGLRNGGLRDRDVRDEQFLEHLHFRSLENILILLM